MNTDGHGCQVVLHHRFFSVQENASRSPKSVFICVHPWFIHSSSDLTVNSRLRRCPFFMTHFQCGDDGGLFADGHSRPTRNLVPETKTAKANVFLIELANAIAWRWNIHAGSKSQNQKPFVCRGLEGQT